MRAAVAEDNVLLREGLVLLLERGGWEVDAVGDADALVTSVERRPPDVVVVDIRMPPTFTDEGIRVAERIRGTHPGVGVLLLSQHIEMRGAIALIAGGTSGIGYLLKERVFQVQEFLQAVERVASGGSAIDPIVVERALRSRRTTPAIEHLTPREREVLSLMAQGLSNSTIATRLVVSDKTVDTHINRIFGKLALSDRDGEHKRVSAVLAWLRDQQTLAP